MLSKLITCHVYDNQKDVFSYTQQHWAALAHVDGFTGQLGGWNVEQPHEAAIVGVWEDARLYQNFMKNAHDSIFYKSGQKAAAYRFDVKVAEKSEFHESRYRFFRSSAIEARYMMVTTCKLMAASTITAAELVQKLTHPYYRCLLHISAPIEEKTVTIVSLYGTALPEKTVNELTHPDVTEASQQLYALEPKWLVLKHPS